MFIHPSLLKETVEIYEGKREEIKILK